MRPVVIQSRAMNMVKMSRANPMSFSTPMTIMARAQAKRIGNRGLGSTTRRSPIRAVGIDSSSFFSAK